jgi:hypothetical protein
MGVLSVDHPPTPRFFFHFPFPLALDETRNVEYITCSSLGQGLLFVDWKGGSGTDEGG